jgi:transposase
MRMETSIRRSLGLKAHAVVKVEKREAGGTRELRIYVERLGQRRLRCGVCGLQAPRVAPTGRPERRWRDLAIRTHTVWLVYAPYRVWCARCGLRVERIPWAELWQRVTQETGPRGRHVGPGPAVAADRRARPQLENDRGHCRGRGALGARAAALVPSARDRIDEVSRRKGHQYLTIVSDLERGRVVWVGRDRSAVTMQQFFTWLGPRRVPSIRTVCCDMWALYLDALHRHLPQATVLFDRFQLTQHLGRAVDDVRRQTWRQMRGRQGRVQTDPVRGRVSGPWACTGEPRTSF